LLDLSLSSNIGGPIKISSSVRAFLALILWAVHFYPFICIGFIIGVGVLFFGLGAFRAFVFVDGVAFGVVFVFEEQVFLGGFEGGVAFLDLEELAVFVVSALFQKAVGVFDAGLLACFGVGVVGGGDAGVYPFASFEGVGLEGDVGELGEGVVGLDDGALAGVGVDDLVLVAYGVISVLGCFVVGVGGTGELVLEIVNEGIAAAPVVALFEVAGFVVLEGGGCLGCGLAGEVGGDGFGEVAFVVGCFGGDAFWVNGFFQVAVTKPSLKKSVTDQMQNAGLAPFERRSSICRLRTNSLSLLTNRNHK
jgi:hypothetical protein